MKNSGVNNRKIKSFLKSNYKFILLALSLTSLNIFFLCRSFSSNSLNFDATFIFMLLTSIVLEIILCIIILIAKHQKWPVEKIFLILGLIVGIFYVFALPISREPDGESHFFRVYEITTGHIISDTAEDGTTRGSVQASNIEIVRNFKENNVKYTELLDNLLTQANESEQKFVRTSASNYNPIIYSPQVIGMSVGKVLHLPFLISAYIGKLFNLIICILILYFSIKYVPFLKEFIFFITFLPITMQAMSSLSADGFITTAAIALVSFVLYSIYTKKSPFTKKHYATILVLCLILSLSKIVYAFLCFLLFAIPKERFKNKKTKLIAIFTIGGVCLITLFSWLFLSSSLSESVDPTNKNLLLHNPLKYLAIFFNSLSVNSSLYLNGTLGGYLEWFNVVLSPLYLFPSLIIFVILCREVHEKFSTTKTIRILSIIIFSIIFLSTFVAMFTQWTKPGETVIDGVQGRYFLPIIILIPLSLIPIKKQPSLKNLDQNYLLYAFFIFESIYAITSIVCSHL